MSSKGGGEVPTTSNVTTTTQVDEWTKALKEGLLGTAQGLLGQEGPYYYPGLLQAPFSPYQLAAQAGTAALATDPSSYRGMELGNLAADYAQSPQYTGSLAQSLAANTQFLNPNERYVTTNPYLQDAIYGAILPTAQSYSTQILPGLRSQGQVTAGQFGGGSRQGIAEGLAASGALSTMGGIAGDMAYKNYNDASNRALLAAGQQSQVANAPLAGLQAAQQSVGMGLDQAYKNLGMLNAVGAEQQTWAQNLINGEVTRWVYNNTMPIQKLQLYGNIVNGIGGTGSTSTQSGVSTVPGATVSPLQLALSGGMLGYGLSNAGLFGSAVAAGAPVGAGLGVESGLAAGGGLLGGGGWGSIAPFLANPWGAAAVGAAMFLLPSLF